MSKRGVVYVAYGKNAINQFYVALQALSNKHRKWPVSVIGDRRPQQVQRAMPFNFIYFDDPRRGARWAKLNVDILSPYEYTLYMDADTRVRYDISAIWDILKSGWDMCAVPTGSQTRTGMMRHVFLDENGINEAGLEERNATVDEVGWPFCGWQGGVIGFRKCDAIHSFFDVWRDEWKRWGDQDQPAYARAYRRQPVRCFPLGYYFNGGGGVGHYHSRARSRGYV